MANDCGQPERYLDDGLLSAGPAKMSDRPHDHWTVRIGRRSCPGKLVAQREIWPAVTRMLWAFDFAEVSGRAIDLNEYDGASGRSPARFEIALKPRFSGVVEVIAGAERTWTN